MCIMEVRKTFYFPTYLPQHLSLIKAQKYLYMVPCFIFSSVLLSEKLRNGISKNLNIQSGLDVKFTSGIHHKLCGFSEVIENKN